MTETVSAFVPIAEAARRLGIDIAGVLERAEEGNGTLARTAILRTEDMVEWPSTDGVDYRERVAKAEADLGPLIPADHGLVWLHMSNHPGFFREMVTRGSATIEAGDILWPVIVTGQVKATGHVVRIADLWVPRVDAVPIRRLDAKRLVELVTERHALSDLLGMLDDGKLTPLVLFSRHASRMAWEFEIVDGTKRSIKPAVAGAGRSPLEIVGGTFARIKSGKSFRQLAAQGNTVQPSTLEAVADDGRGFMLPGGVRAVSGHGQWIEITLSRQVPADASLYERDRKYRTEVYCPDGAHPVTAGDLWIPGDEAAKLTDSGPGDEAASPAWSAAERTHAYELLELVMRYFAAKMDASNVYGTEARPKRADILAAAVEAFAEGANVKSVKGLSRTEQGRHATEAQKAGKALTDGLKKPRASTSKAKAKQKKPSRS